jgi:hypothetical protein
LRGPLARQAVERQPGHDAGSGLRSGVDNRLVGGTKDALHGLEIDSLPRHVGRFLVLVIDLREALQISSATKSLLEPAENRSSLSGSRSAASSLKRALENPPTSYCGSSPAEAPNLPSTTAVSGVIEIRCSVDMAIYFLSSNDMLKHAE